jgi:activator of HSP90 ATPase
MRGGFTLAEIVPAAPSEIYAAWLSSAGHAAMTGSPATVDGNPGGVFRAWDGYITGRTLALEPDRRIVQAWRTSEFPDSAPDSRLEVVLEEIAEGTRVTLTHTDLPEEQADSYRQGWTDFYFRPMKEYFSSRIAH